MKMSKNYKRLCIVLGLGTALFATVVDAANYTKTLKATYRDIGVNYNGTSKTLSAEPFLVDGSTYVPLRAVSEIMGANVKWDGTSGTVSITDNSSSTASLQQELAAKTYEVTTLTRELETVKAELATYKNSTSTGTDISSTAISKTLTKLSDTYATTEKVDWEFDLTQKSSKLVLTISYDSRYDDTKFNRISSSSLKSFVDDVCETVRESHSNIEIEGTITDSRNDVIKADFTYSKTDRLSFDLRADSYATFANSLRRYYSSFNSISYNAVTNNNGNITTTTANFSLPINDITLSEGGGIITFTVNVNLSDNALKTSWNAINRNGEITIEDLLLDIQGDIEDEYGFDVEGIVKDTYTGNTIGVISSSGRFTLKTI